MEVIRSENLALPKEKDVAEIFEFQDMSDVIVQELEPTKLLIGDLVYPEEVTMLFGRSNVGKTFLAVQWAEAISTGTDLNLGDGIVLRNECEPMKVIYFDFELSKKQIQKRYDKSYKFKNIVRATLKRGEYVGNEPKDVVKKLKTAAEKNGAKCIIVDNISAISGDIEKSSQAVEFMQSLMRLAKDEKFTVLVIAHTPKLKEFSPISLEDIAGSNKINQLTDAAVAIGKANCENDNQYYIIHVKTRNNAITHHRGNVIHTTIENNSGAVGHKGLGFSNESELLNPVSVNTDKAPNRAFYTYASLYYGSVDKAIPYLKEIGIDAKRRTMYDNIDAFKQLDSKSYNAFVGYDADRQKEMLESQSPNQDKCLALREGHIPKDEDDLIPV